MKKVIKSFVRTLLTFFICLLIEQVTGTGLMAQDQPASSPSLKEEQLASISKIVNKAIRYDKIPGAVILIGTDKEVVYCKSFGHRSIVPRKMPMTVDTIFDLASLTKVVATTTAVMQLVEEGKLNLDDPVAKYWPEFSTNGKEWIKVKDLLTHYSGLRSGLDLKPNWSGTSAALKMISEEKPVAPPGTRLIYSDINFQILGELVRRVSGQPLDLYCAEHIFKPLGMKDTGFNLSPDLRKRIAPTQYQNKSKGIVLCGEVHDPTAHCMGGVAGHAGLFSTADDLSVFAQMLLGGGRLKEVQVLSPQTVEKMTTPQTPLNKRGLRGLGWELNSPFASNRDELPLAGSYGHTGFTGTSIWIDPVSKTYVIILTNQVHPKGKGRVKTLRSEVLKLVSASLGPVSVEQVLSRQPSLTAFCNLMAHDEDQNSPHARFQTGIDVLKTENFLVLAGKRIGLITNHTGRDSTGQRTIDLLARAPGVQLTVIFSPEHGLSGEMDETISSSTDSSTGLPVQSLYGKVKRPTKKMLKNLDAIVFDIQDAGVCFYTYISTMGYAMEAAAKRKIPFYVLDRPNPITASMVQGPVLDKNLRSFTGYFSLPTRHGMTIGELAQLFNVENKMGLRLHVIKMKGYQRTDWYDETGLTWVNPSPNLRSLTEAALYPGVAMVEGANVSVGRGTETPFELLGTPWMNADELALYLNDRKIQGVRFTPADFTPASSSYKNDVCHGVRIILVDRQNLDSPALGIEIASALYQLYPKDFQLKKTLALIGSKEVFKAIQEGQDPAFIIQNLQTALGQFCKLRSKYLLY